MTSNEGSPRQKPTKYKKKYETVLHQNELLELKIQQLTKDILHMKASEKTSIGWVFIVFYDRTSILQQANTLFEGAVELKYILNELRNEIESNGSDENLNPKESKSLSRLLELIPKDESAGGGLKATVQELNAKIDSIQEQLTTTPRPPMNNESTGENLFVLTNFDVLKKEIEILKDENSHKERLLADVTSQVKTKEVSLEELQAELKAKEENWNSEKNRLDEKLKKMEVDLENSADEIAACGVHLEEFKNLREKLASGDEDEIKEYLNESITGWDQRTTILNNYVEVSFHDP